MNGKGTRTHGSQVVSTVNISAPNRSAIEMKSFSARSAHVCMHAHERLARDHCRYRLTIARGFTNGSFSRRGFFLSLFRVAFWQRNLPPCRHPRTREGLLSASFSGNVRTCARERSPSYLYSRPKSFHWMVGRARAPQNHEWSRRSMLESPATTQSQSYSHTLLLFISLQRRPSSKVYTGLLGQIGHRSAKKQVSPSGGDPCGS